MLPQGAAPAPPGPWSITVLVFITSLRGTHPTRRRASRHSFGAARTHGTLTATCGGHVSHKCSSGASVGAVAAETTGLLPETTATGLPRPSAELNPPPCPPIDTICEGYWYIRGEEWAYIFVPAVPGGMAAGGLCMFMALCASKCARRKVMLYYILCISLVVSGATAAFFNWNTQTVWHALFWVTLD